MTTFSLEENGGLIALVEYQFLKNKLILKVFSFYVFQHKRNARHPISVPKIYVELTKKSKQCQAQIIIAEPEGKIRVLGDSVVRKWAGRWETV